MTRAHIGHDITLALSLAAVGCGGASSPTAPSPSAAVELRGQAADAVGDAASHPTLRVAPDLVSTTIGVSGTTVTIAVRFASGTFDRAALSTQVMLDTDQNIATGIPGIGDDPADAGQIGSDYYLAVEPTESYMARCANRSSHCSLTGQLTTTQFVADGFDIKVDTSALGNDDGRLNSLRTST